MYIERAFSCYGPPLYFISISNQSLFSQHHITTTRWRNENACGMLADDTKPAERPPGSRRQPGQRETHSTTLLSGLFRTT